MEELTARIQSAGYLVTGSRHLRQNSPRRRNEPTLATTGDGWADARFIFMGSHPSCVLRFGFINGGTCDKFRHESHVQRNRRRRFGYPRRRLAVHAMERHLFRVRKYICWSPRHTQWIRLYLNPQSISQS